MKLKIPAIDNDYAKRDEYEIEIKKDTVSAIIDAVLYDSRISSLIAYVDQSRNVIGESLSWRVALADSGGIIEPYEGTDDQRYKKFSHCFLYDCTDINKRELAPFSHIHKAKQEGKRPVFALLDILEDSRGSEDYFSSGYKIFIDENPDVVPNYYYINVTREGAALLAKLNYVRLQTISDFLSRAEKIKSAMLEKLDVDIEKNAEINIALSISDSVMPKSATGEDYSLYEDFIGGWGGDKQAF